MYNGETREITNALFILKTIHCLSMTDVLEHAMHQKYPDI